MSPFDPSRFVKGNTCLPCCTVTPPSGCGCALFLPAVLSSGGTYASLALAEAAMAGTVASGDNTIAIDCFAFAESEPAAVFSAYSADLSVANQATLQCTASAGTGGRGNLIFYASLTLTAGAVLTVTSAFSAAMVSDGLFVLILADCTGAIIEIKVDSAVVSPYSFAALAAGGEYLLLIQALGDTGTVSQTGTVAVASSSTMQVNPVIALWNDSGTTRNLWACPKLLLPPLTEHTADWYASCADAHDVLVDPLQVSNCVGYLQGPLFLCDSFTATDGGASLTLAQTFLGPASNDGIAWGGINAVAGDALTLTATTDIGPPFTVIANIYDDTGVLVESLVGPSPQVSSPLPYTGRYTVSVQIGAPPFGNFNSCSTIITSSGVMSVNPIEARYDAGLACAGLLDCGDSCP